MYYHPYPYFKSKSIAIPYRPHPHLYPNGYVSHQWVQMPEPRVSSFHNNQSIYYPPYPNVHYPYRQTKTVEVRLDGIYCQTPGTDGGEALQIYGRIMLNDRLLWYKDSNDYVIVRRGNLYPIYERRVFNLEPGEYFTVSGQLYESDTVSDDNMGFMSASIGYNDINPSGRGASLMFKETDQIVTVDFSIRQL
ncbi:hypothetical protein HPB58_12080 [Priestia filamentosa]|uniref:hypothetical protein n=1 Tax=Priestia filamentosa TaxID=1402861 RepID=UPI001FB3D0FC|nr:hypothetical protein [Priestia filamentosa]UOE62859.1 hypothetical protein HPB58_12080 [Priestia filamentosa]